MAIILTATQQRRFVRRLLQHSIFGDPDESVIYALFNSFIALHSTSFTRFTIYHQMRLLWHPERPNERRSENPDVGLINFNLPGSSPRFVLRLGVEAKSSISIMSTFSMPEVIINTQEIRNAFTSVLFQAEDQAKAAYKNRAPIDMARGVDWILLVGVYWTPWTFPPFSEAALTVRSHKRANSEDFVERLHLDKRMRQLKEQPIQLKELYMLGTQHSFQRLEALIQATDALASPYIARLLNCMFHSQLPPTCSSDCRNFGIHLASPSRQSPPAEHLFTIFIDPTILVTEKKQPSPIPSCFSCRALQSFSSVVVRHFLHIFLLPKCIH
ncbi:hypothetical protein C8J56DRAFT_768238 [Mycena floridula]|nr:hypothetical protein C8J56DRAFT_768238 [Mycena floridula]